MKSLEGEVRDCLCPSGLVLVIPTENSSSLTSLQSDSYFLWVEEVASSAQ
jgi:hypothetical protein